MNKNKQKVTKNKQTPNKKLPLKTMLAMKQQKQWKAHYIKKQKNVPQCRQPKHPHQDQHGKNTQSLCQNIKSLYLN
jgi:hypothetical protein